MLRLLPHHKSLLFITQVFLEFVSVLEYINQGKNAQTFVQVDIIITKEYLQFVLWGTIVLELHSQLFALFKFSVQWVALPYFSADIFQE